MALETLLENSDEWFKYYKKLTQDERYKLLKETFSSSIPDELANGIDFVDLFITCFDVLKRERQFGKMSELYDVIYPQKQICGEDFFYVDKALIDSYLFCAEPDRIKQHLASFKEYPVKSIDALINVFNKLVFYNYTDLALDVVKSVHPIVAHSKKLIPGAEMEFEDLIYMEQMQEIYQMLKAGGELNHHRWFQCDA